MSYRCIFAQNSRNFGFILLKFQTLQTIRIAARRDNDTGIGIFVVFLLEKPLVFWILVAISRTYSIWPVADGSLYGISEFRRL